MSGLKKYLNVYDFNTVLPGSEIEIEYKGLNTNSVKKLLTYEKEEDPLKEEELLDAILKTSIITENVNIEDFYVTDRYFLLMKIREATKGSFYQFTIKCPNCKHQSLHTVDLSKFYVKKPENLETELKILNDTITLEMDHPKRKRQKELISTISKKLSNNEKIVEIELVNLASHIKKVFTPDGEYKISDFKELIDFIGELPEIELDKFKEWKERNNFGINLNYDFYCEKCSHETEIPLPLSNFFS